MWWREAVVYQVYPRSFADSDGDGVGDLEGLRARLEHLRRLGVDAVWLSPIYRSPMADFGYDVADHCDVDPLFGDLAALDALVADAHALGLKVLLDWVPNHTSDQHPWFRESRATRDSPRRSWYRWRDGTPERPPNNWRAAFGAGPAWTWDDATGQWYLHTFLPAQPDLNWDEPAVVEAMHGVLRFWLDRGIDGFRADVVHLIGKDPALGEAELRSALLLDVLKSFKAAGVDWQVNVPSDGLFGGYYSQAISKFAPHPAAARLWEEFLYSDQGQNLWLAGGARPVRADAMVKAGTIDQSAFSALPKATGTAVLLTQAQSDKAAAYLKDNWAKSIG